MSSRILDKLIPYALLLLTLVILSVFVPQTHAYYRAVFGSYTVILPVGALLLLIFLTFRVEPHDDNETNP